MNGCEGGLTLKLNGGTCAERLPDHLSGRLADFRAMLDRDDPDEPTEAERSDYTAPPALYEYGLHLAVKVSYSIRYELSTGGPADYITATVDEDRDIVDVLYHFADWGDHAAVPLTGDDLDTVEALLRQLVDVDSIEEYTR